MKTCTTRIADNPDRRVCFVGVMLTIALMVPSVVVSQPYSNPATVDLLTAGNFRVLAGSTVTISSGTTVSGDVGVSPGTTVTNGGTVTGTIHPNDAAAVQAQIDLVAAYTDAAGRTADATLGVELGGTTLGCGVYAAGTFTINGELILSGTATDVFIFQSGATLITGTTCIVSLTGGAVWSNVFWQVTSSATIEGDFKGVILALTAITQNAGASSIINGRALARNAAVTVSGTSVLPVELVAFTAAPNRMTADLRWSTATEVNNYGFDVERAAISGQLSRQTAGGQAAVSSLQFTKIGFVKGAGTSNSPRDYSYSDKNLPPGTYAYRIKQIDLDGSFKFYGNAEVEIMAPTEFALEPNYPNPFNPATTFSFSLPSKSLVSLKVYDALGREVSVVLSEELPAGKYSRQWNAAALTSGVYFYRLVANAIPLGQAGSFTKTNKLLLLR